MLEWIPILNLVMKAYETISASANGGMMPELSAPMWFYTFVSSVVTAQLVRPQIEKLVRWLEKAAASTSAKWDDGVVEKISWAVTKFFAIATWLLELFTAATAVDPNIGKRLAKLKTLPEAKSQ